VKFFLHAPIPPPRLWLASLDSEPPPGHIRLIGATIAARPSRGASTGTDLVPSTGSGDALRVQIQRLLQAFHQCDEGARNEILRVAEVLAGAA
jgi:hypothetical protein